MGPLPNGEYILIVVDYCRQYFEAKIMKTITSEKIIESLEDMFTTHELSLSIRTDNAQK